MPPLVHWTSSTTSRLACATSCMTCRPPGPFLWPYPTVEPELDEDEDEGGRAPKMENEGEGAALLPLPAAAAGTEMIVDEDDLVEVRYASYSGLSTVPISTAFAGVFSSAQLGAASSSRGSRTDVVAHPPPRARPSDSQARAREKRGESVATG